MRAVLKRLQSPPAVGLWVGVLVALAVILLRSTGGLQRLELMAYDWQLRLRPGISEDRQRITLVHVTEEEVKKLRWPLTDETLAQALDILARYKPRAIGVDIYRDLDVPPGRVKLDAVLKSNPQIIATMKFAEEAKPGVQPPAVLKGTEQIGFNDIVVDRDGIVRRGLLYLDDGKSLFHSFALRLALLYLQKEGIAPKPDSTDPTRIFLGKTIIRPFESNDGGYVGADARGYQFLLDYRDARIELPTIDITDLLSEKFDTKAVEDKIVLIGVMAESVPDIFHTPLSSGRRGGDTIYGVVLHANVVNQLLRFALEGSPPTVTPREYQKWFWITLWSVSGSMVGLWVRSPWAFSLLVATGLLLLGLIAQFALLLAWWIPLVPPALGWVGASTIVTAYMSNQEKRQRALLMQLFARHVSPEVAETIWQHRDEFLEGGRPRPQRLTATILFTDLVNFTSVSEKRQPETLLAWLNEYMEKMAQQVVNHGGVINKYIGDSVMAIFGVPLPRKSDVEMRRDAVNAVNCALHMARELVELNRRWEQQNLPMVGMRVGILTGPVVVGSLGGKERLEYTVIGDTVNTASRLEGFDKEHFAPDFQKHPCRILIGETTHRYLSEEFQTERVGEVSLKGKDQKITVYSVLSGTNTQR